MAWQRVEEGLYRAVNPATGRPWPGLFMKLSVRGKPTFVSAKTRNVKVARLRRADRQLRGQRGEPVVSAKLTVAKLLDDLQRHYELDGTWNRNKRYALDLIRKELGPLHPAALVTEHQDHIEEMQARWKRAGMTNPTSNRYANYLRRALRWAVIKGRLGTIPIVGRLDESGSRRGKMLPAEEAERLLPELAPWIRGPFILGYDYGIRKGQLLRTRREYVSLARGEEAITWPPAEAKQREPHVIPLEGRSLEIVRAAMAVPKLGCPYLFHGRRCRPGRATDEAALGCVGDFKTGLQAALARAGLPYGRKASGYTFHSTRHAASTNLVAGGMDEADAMKFTGHKTTATFRHYNRPPIASLRAKLEQARAALAACGRSSVEGPGKASRASRGKAAK